MDSDKVLNNSIYVSQNGYTGQERIFNEVYS